MAPSLPEPAFVPSEDVAVLLNAALDALERRRPARSDGEMDGKRTPRAAKIRLRELALPGYFSQVDPNPRKIANEQLGLLEKRGWLRLDWQPGEQGYLLEAISLPPKNAPQIFRLLDRTPLADRRAGLEDLIRGELFRFPGSWQGRALRQILRQIEGGKSPAPFALADPETNQDLLTALAGVGSAGSETPYRAFSVRLFNDSKRFEDLKRGLARLAVLGRPEWKRLGQAEVLRELNLVPNPDYLYLSGPWELVDGAGEVLSLGGFRPSVGFPAAQAAGLQRVCVPRAAAVICIENATPFHELARRAGPATALLCLWGNPSPACRHFLRRLAESLPEEIPLNVWADMDYGGFRILAQLREHVAPRFAPSGMDVETLEAHALWARPLTQADRRNLERLSRRPALADVRPVIEHMLRRGLKLEQEALEPGMPG